MDYRIDCAGCSAWCALKLHEQNSRCSPGMLSLCKILTELLFYVTLYKEVEEKYAGEMRCGRNYNAHIVHVQKIFLAWIKKADRQACEAVTVCTQYF